MTDKQCPSCGFDHEPPPWQMCLDRWHVWHAQNRRNYTGPAGRLAMLAERATAAEARVLELEAAIAKHRAAIEPERCMTCTTDSHQLWQLLDKEGN